MLPDSKMQAEGDTRTPGVDTWTYVWAEF